MTLRSSCTEKISAVLSAVVFLVMALPSFPAAAVEQHLLLIHGRASPCPGPPNGGYNSDTCGNPQAYGVFTTDRMKYWGLTSNNRLVTFAQAHFVQWDAWARHFYQHGAPGGFSVIQQAMHAFCDGSKGQLCHVICHSAGCAALEYYIATSGEVAQGSHPIHIGMVIAGASAAGGSELAQQSCNSGAAFLIGANNIDCSLRMADARNAYDHGQMHGVPILGIAGTQNTSWTACSPIIRFPGQTGSGLNPDCSICSVGGVLGRACSDDDVALHSSCGHSRVASFQDCNSRIFGRNDTAGTYAFHGWWAQAGSGPFSSLGKGKYNPNFRTYRITHGDAKKVAIQEYTNCPANICP